MKGDNNVRSHRLSIYEPRRTPSHKNVRLEFSKMHIEKPQIFWDHNFWTNETKLTHFDNNSHVLCVHRPKNETSNKYNITYGGTWGRLGSVLGLLCCGTGCVESVQGMRKPQDYQGTVEQCVLPIVRKLCLCCRSRVLRQVNESKLTRKNTQE